jgi:CSLREA domain-containing protein
MVAGVNSPKAKASFPLTVTKSADTNDLLCDSDCSLREAIIAANDNPGVDTIIVPTGTFRLSRTGAGENAANTGDLDITEAVTIRGNSSANTGIKGVGDRVFDIQPGASATISALAILEGNAGGATGGGILATGDLTLRRVVLYSNTASSGGGVFQFGGTLSITGSFFLANHAVGGTANPQGGGLATLGATTILSTTFTLNTATEGAGAREGGAIFVQSTSLTLRNSTVVKNEAVFTGGIAAAGSSLTLNNDTIAKNTATSGSGGGGIDHFSDGTKFVTMGNTIVAANNPRNCHLTANTMTSQGHNLDTGTSCQLNGNGDQTHTPAGLTRGLGVNGGPVPTMALLPASAAVNHGGTDCEPKDQRGVTRPQGPACDAGAYEMPRAIVTRPLASTVHHRTFTLAWKTAHAGPGTGAFDVRFRQRAIGAPGFGSFHAFRGDTTARSGPFTGEFGHQYCFSARAIDSGGNRANYGPERCVRVTH